MSEYDKLTVVKLREELVKRGLPKTGLKAALVQRLEEADAQNESGQPAPTKSQERVRHELTGENHGIAQEPPSTPSLTLEDVKVGDDAPTANDSLSTKETRSELAEGPEKAERDKSTGAEEEAPENALTATVMTQNEGFIAPASIEPANMKDAPEAPVADSDLPQDTTYDVLPAYSTQPAQQFQSNVSVLTQNETQSQENIVPSIAGTEEIMEDSRKRKRRSQSPPPSSIDTQKRLKADNGRPRVELPEDSPAKADASIQDSEPIVTSKAISADKKHLQMDGPVDAKGGSVTPERNGASTTGAASSSNHEAGNNSQVQTEESPIKQSPSDTRFKNLFTAPSKSGSSAQQPPYLDTEDRLIGPAIHSATSALYIRELMRPLKPENVKDQLAALATPPDAPLDSNIVTDFFLDSIRTHCLVRFANVSAASRVRSGLHDRIWPNERDRRPLFVDFVPEEKLKKWIDVEQNAPSGRGQPQKRWEVVYEDEGGEVKAYLQEIGSSNGGLRAAQPVNANMGNGVQGAPSGPRIKAEPRSSHSRPDNAKGFQALDDLFKSTNVKPKLYYQPVPTARADQRLEKLAAGRGGGRNDEMRRYTFEDDALVDRAPEFGNRGRGYGGGRSGFSGGYRGRGGGYRGDGYRGGGDSWRDRRSGY